MGGLALVALLLWVAAISLKQLKRHQRIQAEVTALQAEAAKVARENQSISERISYFSSPDFREQEAKQKLGLKKAEEVAVIINPAVRPSPSEPPFNEPPMPQASKQETQQTNYMKWWNIFFKY